MGRTVMNALCRGSRILPSTSRTGSGSCCTTLSAATLICTDGCVSSCSLVAAVLLAVAQSKQFR